MPHEAPRGPETPSYAPKLQDWYDKEVQKANITKQQQALQDQIAAEMTLDNGESVTLTHRNVGYEVRGTMQINASGQAYTSCAIRANPIEEVLT